MNVNDDFEIGDRVRYRVTPRDSAVPGTIKNKWTVWRNGGSRLEYTVEWDDGRQTIHWGSDLSPTFR